MYFSGPLEDLPQGYIFLCPPDQLASDGRYQVSDAAYWSVDPSGAERLTPEEAARVGFPEFQLNIQLLGLRWAEDLYAGLREFHAAKGYDPDSPDLAKDLGYPLFEITCDKDKLQAYRKSLVADVDISDIQ
ncbi:hypothetical protein FB45DRAFT_742742 [Roridomyces roridus]|uniref:Uncharacterized protein n=1 Tax=Roridomyces roridus TaxID=1738132 RepID=A0AAD7C1F3_9AGAR|nr:hypothetical protein FB45DRAFT_742742 [Roridomyces roridus]